jgi:hypothetical protein
MSDKEDAQNMVNSEPRCYVECNQRTSSYPVLDPEWLIQELEEVN